MSMRKSEALRGASRNVIAIVGAMALIPGAALATPDPTHSTPAAANAPVAAPQDAPAQTADDGQQGDEIVVTGFRASLQNALNIKRSSNQIVDAITAEDIADFPDANLAESIQRLPGVSIDRDNGE